MKIKKTIVYTILIIVAVSSGAIVFADQQVESRTSGAIFSSAGDVPASKAGLLLGTAKLHKSGRPNLYFTYRIDAAETLFKAGKITYIVISGDNSRKDYNEPQDMKDALVERGVPAERIYLDYAGFRTFDSVYRMEAIFGQMDFVVISQAFHVKRAV